MDSFVWILIALIVVLTIVAVYIFVQSRHRAGQESQNILKELERMREEVLRVNFEHRQEIQTQLHRVNDSLFKGMSEQQRALTDSRQALQQQFEQTSKIIQEVTTKLVTLDATNKQVLDFSSQLQNLQNILRNPKQRGVLGEYWLETLLSNVLPKDAYGMQFRMGSDESTGKELIADAAIFVREQIIPIDAKFSLENYNRLMEEQDPSKREKLEKDFKLDIQQRIDETSKYIQPQKGTMNFAFMFIPAEGVYYNLMNAEIGSGINSRNLLEYAFSKHVMIVSPTSFFAYLQTVLLGLRELQLEKSTQDILKRVSDLGKHVRAFAELHSKMGNNLATVVNQFNQSSNELKKVSKDVVKITDGSADELIEIDALDRPQIEA